MPVRDISRRKFEYAGKDFRQQCRPDACENGEGRKVV